MLKSQSTWFRNQPAGREHKPCPPRVGKPDPVDASGLVEAIVAEKVRFWPKEGKAGFELPFEHYPDFEIYFPAPDGQVDERYLTLARRVLPELGRLDAIVQQRLQATREQAPSSVNAWQCSGELGCLTLKDPATCVLHYWGNMVNTSWDEVFTLEPDGSFRHRKSGMEVIE